MQVKQHNESAFYSSVVNNITSSHGVYLFVGKHAQGRVAPVEASKQKGRRGLGMAPSNFELESDLAWREEEVCTLIRTVL